MKYRENIDSYKITENRGNVVSFGDYLDGRLITKHGLVEISAHPKHYYVRFDVVFNGRHYIKTINDVKDLANWSRLKLHKQASKFMKEIVSKNTL